MKAIIMAAGVGSRLSEINDDKPKCLIKAGEQTLIKRIVTQLQQRNIDDITVITGYERHFINQELGTSVKYFHNPFYQVTNSIASLWLAKNLLSDSVLLMNADLFFEDAVLDMALLQTRNAVMLSDHTRIETADYRFSVRGDIILKTGNTLSNHETDCEYVGIVRIDHSFIKEFKDKLETMIKGRDFNNWWEGVLYSFMEDGVNIFHKDVEGAFWTEIDHIGDYQRLQNWVSKNNSALLMNTTSEVA